jgi:hypothetical protein
MINKSRKSDKAVARFPEKYTNTKARAEAFRVFTHKKPILPHCGLLYLSHFPNFFPLNNFHFLQNFKASKVNSSGVLQAK